MIYVVIFIILIFMLYQKYSYDSIIRYAPKEENLNILKEINGIVVDVSYHRNFLHLHRIVNGYDYIKIEYIINDVTYSKNIVVNGSGNFLGCSYFIGDNVKLLYEIEHPENVYLKVDTKKLLKKSIISFIVVVLFILILVGIIYGVIYFG